MSSEVHRVIHDSLRISEYERKGIVIKKRTLSEAIDAIDRIRLPTLRKVLTILDSANNLYKCKNMFRAEQCLLKALEIAPWFVYTRMFLGNIYYNMGRLTDAIEHLQYAFEREEEIVHFWYKLSCFYKLGVSYYKISDFTRAIKILERVLYLVDEAMNLYPHMITELPGKVSLIKIFVHSLKILISCNSLPSIPGDVKQRLTAILNDRPPFTNKSLNEIVIKTVKMSLNLRPV